MNRRVLLLAAAILLPFSLLADDVTLTLTSPGNNPAGFYYASPYQATVQGTGQVLTVYCIDFNHDVSVGQTWQAVKQSLTQSNVAAFSQEGSPDPVTPMDPNAWQDYSTAAYLIDQLILSASSYWGAVYQYAAWRVFLPYGNNQSMINADNAAYNASVLAAEAQFGNGTKFATDIAAAFTAATTAVHNGTYTPMNFDLITSNPAGLQSSVQEFLVKVPPVPEPSSIILLATAALATVLKVRRRRSRTTNPIA